MSKIIRVAVILAVIYFLRNFFAYSMFSGILSLAMLGGLIYLIYLIVLYTAQGNRSNKRKEDIPQQKTLPKVNADKSKLWIFGTIAIFLLIYFLREFLGRKSFDSFLFLDNLLKISSSASPVLMWGFLGLFIGLIYGSLVAWKKYNLDFKLNFIPLSVFAIVMLILLISNKPFNSDNNDLNQRPKYGYGFVTVEASSVLPSYKNSTYEPVNLIDQDDNTAWIKNNKNQGKEDFIIFTFNIPENEEKSYKLIGFRIKNGLTKSSKTWNNYSRLKTFSIFYNEKSNLIGDNQYSSASDYFNTYEEIKIAPVSIKQGDKIGILISSVYAGAKFPSQIAITDLIPILQY